MLREEIRQMISFANCEGASSIAFIAISRLSCSENFPLQVNLSKAFRCSFICRDKGVSWNALRSWDTMMQRDDKEL